MKRLLSTVSLVPILFLPVVDLPAQADAGSRTGSQVPAAGGSYLRLLRNGSGTPIALQTRTVRFAAPRARRDRRAASDQKVSRPRTVDLIGVVHMADRGYFAKLNRSFAAYDALLYELVGPQGARPVPGAGSAQPLRMLQRLGEASLGLASQLDHIDYQAANFVHADLSPAGMREAMRARGESGLSLALGVAADLLRQANRASEQDASATTDLLLGGGGDLKQAMATALATQTENGGGLGPTLDALLIGDRNAAAIRVMERQWAQGKTRLGIFYGAAHMPDFERRLREKYGLEPVSEEWHTAWRLDGPRTTPTQGVFEFLLRELQSQKRPVPPRRKPAPKPIPKRAPPRRRFI